MKFCISCWISTACLCLLLSLQSFSQQTDRTPFALEIPELNTGKMVDPKNYIASADVNFIKFWILNPAAESIDWDKIKVRINRQAANIACSQNPASIGKVMRCDLNRFAGLRLQPNSNIFEAEAVNRNGQRFYASFVVIIVAKVNVKQNDEIAKVEKPETKIPDRPGFSGRKFAVVIGVSKYQYNDIGLGNLNYADDDADALYEWLTKTGSFNPQDILYMTNESAVLSAVRDSLNRFLSRATENDLVLFFLAGHGTPDPFNPRELYYLLYDSKIADLKNTGFPMAELKQIIDTNLRSKRAIFFLDTCHSAGVSGKKVVPLPRRQNSASGSSEGARDLTDTDFDERILERVEVKNDVSAAATRLFGSDGRAVLTSSDINEASRESRHWGGGHGVFTWALLEGLRGGADANSDKVITSAELFNFVRQKVRAETKEKQNPRLFSNLRNELEITILK